MKKKKKLRKNRMVGGFQKKKKKGTRNSIIDMSGIGIILNINVKIANKND